MDELIVVSVDSHATMPAELWPEYLERRYHDQLPGLREDNDLWTRVTGRFADQMFADPQVAAPAPELHPIVLAHFDGRGGYLKEAEGDRRLAEMDLLLNEDLAEAGASL